MGRAACRAALADLPKPSILSGAKPAPRALPMKTPTEQALAKVPEVTLGFWLIKIAATTLGETGGDAVSMSMNTGYPVSTGIFAVLFWSPWSRRSGRSDSIRCCTGPPSSPPPRSARRWRTSRTARWASAMQADRCCCWPCCSALCWRHRTLGSVSVGTVHSRQGGGVLLVTIMFSQTLGTALGDWTADTAGLGLHRRGRRLRRTARLDPGRPLRHPRVPHAAVLGGVHPDPPPSARWSATSSTSR